MNSHILIGSRDIASVGLNEECRHGHNPRIFKQSRAAPIDLNLQPPPTCHGQGLDGTVDVGISGLEPRRVVKMSLGQCTLVQRREH